MSRGRFAAISVAAALIGVAACGADGSGVAVTKSDSIASDAPAPPAPDGTDDTAVDTTTNDTTTDDTATDTTDDTTTVEEPPPADSGPDQPGDELFGWTKLGGGLAEGTFAVPMDYDDPGVGEFELHVVRHDAAEPSQRIGTLLVNPGGPGVSGTYLAEFAEQIYGQSVVDAFDIVAWDPRGTGLTEPGLDCVDDYDAFFALDASPDTAQEQQAILDAANEFGASCRERSGGVLAYVSTEATARDMEQMRLALEEDTISYFGFSYGSEIGVTWASLFPDTVRALVIDGAADQSVGHLQQNLEQAAGFEGTFDTFLAECSANPECAFHNDGDAEGAFDALNAAADESPVDGPTGRPSITQGVLTTAVNDALYSEFTWPELEGALADLQGGDGERILGLYDDYYSRQPDGTYDNSLEAYFAINCLDDPGTKDPQVLFDMQDEFASVAPRLGASWILELQFCAAWPVPAAAPVAVDAAGAGPVVVVGTTGDPATPLVSTRKMAEALEDGRLIVVTADQHTGYGLNDCVNEAVDDYLVDLVVPDNELACE